jgi:hypothetical protein
MHSLPTPTLSDFAEPGEMLLVTPEVAGPTGRRRYFLGYWITEALGPHRVVGEAFCTFPDQFAATGRRPVRVFHPTPERS